MVFRDLAIETLRTRLALNENALQDALAGLSEEESNAAEQVLDAIEAISDRLPQLEGEHSADVIELFRESLVRVGGHAFATLGLTDIRETYFLAKLINSVPTEDWSQEIPDTESHLYATRFDGRLEYWDVDGSEITVFASPNTESPAKSVALFKIPILDEGYVQNDQSTEVDGYGLSDSSIVKIRLIACLLRSNSPLSGNNFIICNRRQKSLIKTALDFHIVARGFLTSKPQRLTSIFGTHDVARHIQAARSNSQMNEPLEILSEINSRETVIEKFLSSYHALENYMLRVKFAKLQNGMSDRTFRIRDLKVLGSVSDEKELTHLKQLFDTLWDKTVCGEGLIRFALNQLNTFRASPEFDQAEFNEFLQKLGMTTKSGSPKTFANADDLRSSLPALIYQVRCSIVHHKATEYHISNRTLQNQTLRQLHAILLIPIMARIAFGLPLIEVGNPLRYEERNIQLY